MQLLRLLGFLVNITAVGLNSAQALGLAPRMQNISPSMYVVLAATNMLCAYLVVRAFIRNGGFGGIR